MLLYLHVVQSGCGFALCHLHGMYCSLHALSPPSAARYALDIIELIYTVIHTHTHTHTHTTGKVTIISHDIATLPLLTMHPQ